METIAELPAAAFPLLRRAALGAHGLLTAWLLINGVAHEIGVVVKANAGTLRPDASVPSLLLVGAGLVLTGIFAAFGVAPLARAAGPSALPAFLGLASLAVVIALIAMEYGFTFLGGTIAVGLLDLVLVTAHVTLNAPSAPSMR